MQKSHSVQFVQILWALSLAACRAGTNEFFGLEHLPLGAAEVVINENPSGLLVSNLEFTGARGVATHLGAADSGAFFFLTTERVDTGYFMRGHAFGHVNGQPDAPIGFVSGYRAEYATFHARADFAAIGATSLTYQAWYENLLVYESTVVEGEATIYSDNSSDVRANPWWRQGNDRGASIRFRYPAQVVLPGCASNCVSSVATHLFIRANGATSVVHSVSRTEVYGGGGLPGFSYQDVRLGMFGHAHAVLGLGPVKFNATNGVLRMDLEDPLVEGGSGTLVELEHVAKAEVQLLPIDLARPNTNAVQEQLDISLSGTFADEGTGFVGAAALANSNGVLHLSAYLYETGPLFVNVFSNGAPVGPPNLEMPGPIQITGTGRVASVGANADMLSAFPGFTFAFDAPIMVHTTQGVFVGDRINLAATNGIRLVDLVGLAITAKALPSFTITGESSTSIVPKLSIQRTSNSVVLTWPDPAVAYVLQTRSSFTEDTWDNIQYGTTLGNGISTATYVLPGTNGPAQYFRLMRYIYQD